MRTLILCAVFSIASAKPGGLYSSGWDAPSISSLSLVQQPAVHVAQPVVQQYVHAPVAIAKPAATSYSSFQRVIHPSVVQAAPVVHAAPVISQPIVHAPVVSQPIVQSYSQPIVQAVAHQPYVQSYSQPIVQSVSHQPYVQSYSQPIVQSVSHQPYVQSYSQPYVQSYSQPLISSGHGW